jgi:MoaA/NifB/PqqE/SkfB family radical SAM enzyme
MVLESCKYFKYVKKSLFKKDKLNYLILYVTSKCNSFCKTCFFHENLNKEDDLSLEEFKKISEKLGVISVLLLSGGEPFLRKDLIEICGIFIENNKVDTLSIPTNGYLPKEIRAAAERLAAKFPKTVISINPSLDGMEKCHDAIRGVQGSFNQAIDTIKKLEDIKKRYKNIQIIVNSVINKDNIDSLKELAGYLSQFNLDYHAFEIMRGDKRDNTLRFADLAEIKGLHKIAVENRKRRIRNIFEKITVIGSIKYLHRIKEEFLAGGKWPVICAAGKSILVIYPNGGVSLCELRKPIANLRDNDYNIKNLMASEGFSREMQEINADMCGCTHICFLNASIARDWKTALKILFYYLKND